MPGRPPRAARFPSGGPPAPRRADGPDGSLISRDLRGGVLRMSGSQVLRRPGHLLVAQFVGGVQRQYGSRSSSRASRIRSAWPVRRICSACTGSVIMPHRAAGDAGLLLHPFGELGLVARSYRDFPHSPRYRRKTRRSGPRPGPSGAGPVPRSRRGSSHPPQSVADSRTNNGNSSGQALRTAAVTCRSRRMRFSKQPPYWSRRWFDSGERN